MRIVGGICGNIHRWLISFASTVIFLFTIDISVPPIEIHRRMQGIYGYQCVDMSTVRHWVRWFKDGELGQADLSDKTQRTDFRN